LLLGFYNEIGWVSRVAERAEERDVWRRWLVKVSVDEVIFHYVDVNLKLVASPGGVKGEVFVVRGAGEEFGYEVGCVGEGVLERPPVSETIGYGSYDAGVALAF
jgi:hypothetical protein